jgi:hypothetical protein
VLVRGEFIDSLDGSRRSAATIITEASGIELPGRRACSAAQVQISVRIFVNNP